MEISDIFLMISVHVILIGCCSSFRIIVRDPIIHS